MQAPKTSLLPLHTPGPVIEIETFYGLPDDHKPEVSLYITEDGQWLCERAEEVRALQDGDVIQQGDMAWKFHCAGPVDVTLDMTGHQELALGDAIFHFDVSLDEEHVFLKILGERTTIDLGERVHHYLLLTLARRRWQDTHRGMAPPEQGWIDIEDLSRLLGLEPTHIHIHIFRARQQLVKAIRGFPYLPQIVERRVGSVRFGSPAFTITPCSAVENQSTG